MSNQIKPAETIEEALKAGISPDVLKAADLPYTAKDKLTPEQTERLIQLSMIQASVKTIMQSVLPDLTKQVIEVAEKVTEKRVSDFNDRRVKIGKAQKALTMAAEGAVVLTGISAVAMFTYMVMDSRKRTKALNALSNDQFAQVPELAM